MTTLNKFEKSSIYQMTFIGDSNLKVNFICVKRTAKTVTFEKFQGVESITRRINIDSDGNEYILYGTYSMAPRINSKRRVG